MASVLRQAFAEYEPLYTEQGYAATTVEADEVFIRMQQGPVWVALYDRDIVGTVSAVHEDKGVYVRGMAVLPAAHGTGIGRSLLEEVESFAIANRCKRLFLTTTPFLKRAIRLYECFGFHAVAKAPLDLFGTPLFTMEKYLTEKTEDIKPPTSGSNAANTDV